MLGLPDGPRTELSTCANHWLCGRPLPARSQPLGIGAKFLPLPEDIGVVGVGVGVGVGVVVVVGGAVGVDGVDVGAEVPLTVAYKEYTKSSWL